MLQRQGFEYLRTKGKLVGAKKTGRPVRFELTDQPRQAIDEYLRLTERKPGQLLFAGRGDRGGLTTRQYARLVL